MPAAVIASRISKEGLNNQQSLSCAVLIYFNKAFVLSAFMLCLTDVSHKFALLTKCISSYLSFHF